MNTNYSWAAIFDLDETLVLTSALKQMRDDRKWRQITSSFGKTELPPGTLQFLKTLGQRAQLGVVTRAPRHYAERLLEHHQLQIPVLAAYHDVRRRKPDPEALLLASQKLRIPPVRCVYIGDDADDETAARAANFGFIGVCWGETNGLGQACESWDEVVVNINRLIAKWQK